MRVKQDFARPRAAFRVRCSITLLMITCFSFIDAFFIMGCATSPDQGSTGSSAATSSSASVPSASLGAKTSTAPYQKFRASAEDEAIFQRLWRQTDSQLLRAHLLLKLHQIETSFWMEREALQEFDSNLESSHDASFLRLSFESKITPRILGADVYRTLAQNQLLEITLELQNLAASRTPSSRAAADLDWLARKIAAMPAIEKIAMISFAETFLNVTGPAPETLALIAKIPLQTEETNHLETDPDLQKEIRQRGHEASLVADRELRNWILHFTKSHAEIEEESQYYPVLVGRKHSSPDRTIASVAGSPLTNSPNSSSSLATRSMRAGEGAHQPLRPLTARNLRINEFALIFEGSPHPVDASNLAAELKVAARPATFFVNNGMNESAFASMDSSFKTLPAAAFGTQGNAARPASLLSDREIGQAMDLGLSRLRQDQVREVPFLKPGFDIESGRLSRIAHERGLRVVRVNIESFDEIDFNPQRVADRVSRQTFLLQSGIIRLQSGSPRASIIQHALTARFQTYKDLKNQPRFISLADAGDPR